MSLSIFEVPSNDAIVEEAPDQASPINFTIDQLAQRCATTTRNIRALQSSGVLLRPEIVGRTAHYGDEHLGRLEAIMRLQQSGFSLASIRALFDALSSGLTLAEVLGVTSIQPRWTSLRLLSDLPSTLLEVPA